MALEEIDYDINAFAASAREADKNLAVRFYMQAVQNEVKSVEQGRPIFDDTEMVEIRVRGDRNNVVQRPAREDDKRRFRDAYVAFRENRSQAQSGTPLSEWPVMSASMVEELKYFGFHTVEQVAKADDNAMSKMAGLRMLRDKAVIFMEHAQGTAPLSKLQEELELTRDQLKVEQTNNAKLAAQLEELTAKFNSLAERIATDDGPAPSRTAPRR